MRAIGFGFVVLFLMSGCSQRFTPDGKHYVVDSCIKEVSKSKDFKESQRIDKIVIHKSKREMYLYKNEKEVGKLRVSLGKNPLGHKLLKGDNRTPEGEYFISKKICSASYYRSLAISYPRVEDVMSAKQRGVHPGGNITIHAQPTWNADGQRDYYTLGQDWTQGCVAIPNKHMDDLWYGIRVGVPVTIYQ